MTEIIYGPTPSREVEPVIPLWWRTIDKWSLVAVVGLCAIGLLLGLAASAPLALRNGLNEFHYVERQMIFGAAGFALMIGISLLSPVGVRRIGAVGFVISSIALMLLPFLGTDFGKGATRWFSLGFASVQPSEFIKPCFVVLVGWFIAAGQDVKGPPGKMLSLLVTIFIVALLVVQPDFGQAALIIFGWLVIYFAAGASMIIIIMLSLFAGLAAFVSYNLSEHFARRIDGYLSDEIAPRSQLSYASSAIQEGGFFGVGVGEGQVKWTLPDAHTDFIIAVAAEEYGLLLVVLMIALYVVILVRSLYRSFLERDPFVRLAGTGLVCVFCAQAMINMGVAVRLLPAKGMTLPFVSYGGSSLVAAGLTMGMVLALTRTKAPK